MMGRWILTAIAAAPLWGQAKAITQGPHRLEIVLERREGAAWKAVDPGLVFQQNDRVRFRAKTNFGGYLYVMNRSTSGKYELLFPTAEAGEKNRIEAGREYTVPATQGAFRITGPAGQETVYWLVSPVEMKTEGGADYVPLPPPPKPGKIPPNLTPRCDDTILRARGDCVDTSAGAKPIREKGKVPENLAGIADMTSREVMFMRQANASVVASPQPLEGPVIFEFRLAHR
jgi:hypothetical protein